MGKKLSVVGITVVNRNIINSNITRVLVGDGRLVSGHMGGSIGVGRVLSLESFSISCGSGFAGSFGSVLGSSSMDIMTRIVKNVGPTCSFMGTYLLGNGDIIASGGRLITTGNTRLVGVTGRGGMDFLFRTDINNNVPILEPVMGYLTTGRVSRF